MSAFCALVLVSSAFAADVTNTNTTTKATVTSITNAPTEVWMVSINGTGVTTTENDSNSAFGVNFGLGRTGHLLLPVEMGVRQGINYNTFGGGHAVFDTHVYSDWTVFKYNRVELFAGGNAGAVYGDTKLTWTVAPEAGLRVWIKHDVALVSRVDYPFNINDGKSVGALEYFVGLQIKL